jgi:cell pole-organizing protein PopZ
MPEPTAPEPTMDEILASIRRIITDDDAPEGEAKASEPAAASPSNAPGAKAKAEDTPSVNEVETSGGQAGKAESGKKSSDDTATASEKNMAETKGGEAQVDPDSLVGDKAATDTASAFAKLTVAVKESAGEPSMTMPAPGRSLEDVVRELLRPILKEWLETHLPEIVREHVEEEVARISRGSRPR